jgi:hypothetical protein
MAVMVASRFVFKFAAIGLLRNPLTSKFDRVVRAAAL